MNHNFNNLVSSLKNLSKNYQDQLNSFPDFTDFFDEVLLDFDNAFHLLPTLMDDDLLTYETVKEIIICNNLIASNLTIQERMSDESFEFDNCWNLVREHASNALKLIEERRNSMTKI